MDNIGNRRIIGRVWSSLTLIAAIIYSRREHSQNLNSSSRGLIGFPVFFPEKEIKSRRYPSRTGNFGLYNSRALAA